MSERPGTGELIAGVAGFVLLISMFIFAWFGLEGFTGDAFDTLDDWVNIVLVFTAFAAMSLMLFGPDIPRAEVVPLGAVVVALGALSALIVLIHIIAPPGVEAGPVSVDLDTELGVWIGLVASIVTAVGGFLAIQEEGGGPGGRDTRIGAAPRQQSPPAPPQQQASPQPPQGPPPAS